MAMMVPNTQDLIMDVMTSQLDTARVHESRMMLALTSYTVCASRQLHAMPGAALHDRAGRPAFRVPRGSAGLRWHALTRCGAGRPRRA